jgi:hypothetical protein
VINRIIRKIKKGLEVYSEYKEANNILIYQMGKVGSTSLETAIPGSIHTHTLYDERTLKKIDGWFSQMKKAIGFYVKRVAIRKREKIKIISLIREPLARDMSMFFQLLPTLLHSHVNETGYDARDEGLGLLIDTFEQTYDYQYALRWFDAELKRFSGVDVYSHDYSPEVGFMTVINGKYEVLVIEMNKIQDLTSVIEDFCDQSVVINSANRGGRKWYGSVYKDFKNDFKPSEKYLSIIKSSKFYTHFYKGEK